MKESHKLYYLYKRTYFQAVPVHRGVKAQVFSSHFFVEIGLEELTAPGMVHHVLQGRVPAQQPDADLTQLRLVVVVNLLQHVLANAQDHRGLCNNMYMCKRDLKYHYIT